MLAWMDLEMTGLDPNRDVIVEIATLLTDDNLELLAEGPDLVVSAPAQALTAMEQVVVQMHTKSGLLEEIQNSTLSLQTAGEMTLDFLRSHIAEPGTVPLCGNSIGVDRSFLAEQLPDVHSFFHYRSIDVSTIKELARRWHPAVFHSAPQKTKDHRALDDIRESLAELRHYRDHYFHLPTQPTNDAKN
ncbi:MAG: oligoribonuclease [Acidimicrobiia bacterium]|nr:oligoribonuclease [Acidimicrobiia bacterium]MYC57667.1 oligoribonuclease [Acidimicrobiia bacterium]MYG93572.1 oligoribonuclease [Acidimicrobiia bacterium]MYI31211.1 oligoribonuclease [Acidimicrobiia bacterium]